MTYSFRIGVLIIGSLYWQDIAARKKWRHRRLRMERTTRVRLPIRYGRQSHNWGDTHTMVFSRLCYRHQTLGVGYVAPCTQSIRCWSDLQNEVEELSVAEGLANRNEGWRDWGVVGLLKNPATLLPDSLLHSWQEYFWKRASGSAIFDEHAKSEEAIVSKDGLMMLRWPTLISNKRCPLDLLLATPTVPTLEAKRYPSAKAIADAYCRADCPEYFLKNIQSGIRTFQDLPIANSLVKARPNWSGKLAGLL